VGGRVPTPPSIGGSARRRPRWVSSSALISVHPVGRSWRLEERDVRSKGKWAARSRAVDKEGAPGAVLLTPRRARAAAKALVYKAMRPPGLSEKRPIAQRRRTTAALTPDPTARKTTVLLRQSQALKERLEQEPRAGKRSGPQAVRLPAVQSYTRFARGSWQPIEPCPKLLQSSGRPWLRRSLIERFHSSIAEKCDRSSHGHSSICVREGR
jgi:hypothetical protein